ncbi:type IV secretion system protein VirB10 [Luteibacter sp. UNC138MFCol5.1]|uniref:TrbI/VirB10 family protein n=1 Tax=Luteibacter sp. UNC138MFCol5.1 TaxID=1502774 RepID=UPI0008B38FEA|nr:TrbI/VirB10 family protein [Luteibacter sp. UNC138MFCol5.1]SEO82228.1 type IV secretion system protein VirB10 [Luteibacter sp. UNC138MFCol5.1]
MSPNNPYTPDDQNHDAHEPSRQPHAEQHDPLAGNPYSAHQRQAPPPDLDANAPQLAEADVRRMNRRALAFLAGIVALLLFAAWFFLSGNSASAPPPKPKREETVTVPEAPKVSPVPEQALPRLPEPIALAPPVPLPPTTQPKPMMQPRVNTGPSLMERRMMDTEAAQIAGGAGNGAGAGGGQRGPFGFGPGGVPFPGQPEPGVPVNSAYNAAALPEVSNASPLTHPDTLMLRGTFIRCVLETRIITDIPGFTSCVVTEPIYSFTGKRMLLPKGSKVLGKYEMEPNGPRVAVIWDRIVTPTGIDVNMASPGIDTLGGAGHPGYYNAHWGSRIGSALLISLLSDAFKYEAAEHGPQQTQISNGVVTQNPYESYTAQTLQQIAGTAVRRAANRPATVTINQGTVLAIYVAKDVDFSGVVARY